MQILGLEETEARTYLQAPLYPYAPGVTHLGLQGSTWHRAAWKKRGRSSIRLFSLIAESHFLMPILSC